MNLDRYIRRLHLRHQNVFWRDVILPSRGLLVATAQEKSGQRREYQQRWQRRSFCNVDGGMTHIGEQKIALTEKYYNETPSFWGNKNRANHGSKALPQAVAEVQGASPRKKIDS